MSQTPTIGIPDGMWHHDCPVDGPHFVAIGEACNWCGAHQPDQPKDTPDAPASPVTPTDE